MFLYTRLAIAIASCMLPVIILAQPPQTKTTTEEAPQQANVSSTTAEGACCICPKVRYATYPTYSSYYSKRCDGNNIAWVALDLPDIGPNPNLDCPGCGACFSDGPSLRGTGAPSNLAVSHALVSTGLEVECARDYAPTTEHGAVISTEFVAKILLSDDGRKAIYAKLFLISTGPGNAGVAVFGQGLETVSGEHDIEIPWENVTPLTEGAQPKSALEKVEPVHATHCLRVVIRNMPQTTNLTNADTEFQVITKTPVESKVAQ